jgi:quercetin dioxygenase-like cupin family protein
VHEARPHPRRAAARRREPGLPARDPRRRTDGRPLPLVDDRQAGLRAYLLTLEPRQHATPHIAHKGVELVAVVSGLVQVVLDSGRPVLRRGETLLAERSAVLGWRNLGESDATLFWILRDG